MAATVKPFAGRLALVTGGGGGIGEAVCTLLAAEGAIVVVADVQLEAAKKVADSLPGDATHQAMYVDVGDSSSVQTLFKGIGDAYSEPLSIVVNAAGILRPVPILECTDELFDDIIRVNLRGTFLVTREASRYMLRSGIPLPEGGAAIVNIASIAAKIGSATSAAYPASKAGVVAFTKSAAQELAPHGIRSNVVLPSFTDTSLLANAPPGRIDACLSITPLKRIAQPREVAEAIKFLCSPTASSYVSGAALEVTGGFYM
ncbi:estradiol 17-beta-dehydrogenase 8 [Rhipicephalus sanguineus]|uniref:(3R)-3-hydroxyacyl-CoA dehydrogenase n=1 Tax=Rhipicephalus sanguineus TaxID=34632 RepID=A0A9D4QB17_RHISA|nr:estradiol 17-beta-dehydrogenase 8 [Rhipicephalus sanguineus]KAH7973011.1 hypothetical protein HPB52_020316 [Rhipicephalus sanguineus]